MRPAGRPPTAGAYGRRRVRGPRRLGPIPDAPAARGGGGDSQERQRRRGSRLGLLRPPRCRQSSRRQLPPAAPVSGPSSAPAGLGRRLRSATARRAALRAEPGRPPLASGRGASAKPLPGARPQPRPVAPSPPGGRLGPDPELPPASPPAGAASVSAPSAAPNLTVGPHRQKYTFLKKIQPPPKKGLK